MVGGLRERVLCFVQGHPGASTREVARAVGIAESTADYHLRRLAKGALVRKAAQGRVTCWYSVECKFCPVLRRAIPALRRPEALAVLSALGPRPMCAAEVAKKAGLSVGAVRWAAAALRPTFLVERSERGRILLRPGADLCAAHATRGTVCAEWGRCPVSVAWEAAQAPTSSR